MRFNPTEDDEAIDDGSNLGEAKQVSGEGSLSLNELENAVKDFIAGIVQPIQQFQNHLAAKALYRKGTADSEAGKFDDAIAAFRQAHTLDPNNPEICLTLGQLLHNMQQTEDAIALYQDFRNRHSAPPMLQVAQATALLDIGQVQDAIAAVTPLPDLSPATVALYKVLGRAYEEIGELGEAQAHYRQVLGMTQTADLYAKYGELLLRQGQIEDAIEQFRQATTFSDVPGRVDARLALLLQQHYHYDEAVNIYDRAIARSPNPAFWHCLKSMLYLEQGNIERSLDEFSIAVTSAPQTVPLWPYMLIERRLEQPQHHHKLTEVYHQHIQIFEQLDPERSQRILQRIKREGTSIEELQIALTRFRRAPQPRSKPKPKTANRPHVKRSPQNDFRGVFLEPIPDSNVLLVAFAGVAGQFYLPTFEFSSATESLVCSRLFLRDTLSLWYQAGIPELGDSPDHVADYIRSVVNDLKIDRIVTIGNSAGGYAALLFGALLQADEVHAFAPQTFLTSSHEYRWNSRASGRLEQLPIDVKYGDLRSLLAAHVPTRFHVYYSEQDQLDSYHAQRIAHYAGVTLHPYREGGHGIIRQLKQSGELDRILMQAIAPDSPPIPYSS